MKKMSKNELQVASPKMTFSAYITSTGIKNKINQLVGDEVSGKRFISSIVSAVSTNPQLAECDNASIVSGALLGEALKLSPSPQLGNYYLVPFKDKEKGQVATFQLGYKGYIQLAIRSGQYKKLNVLAIKEGELIKYDPLNEEIEVNLIEDETKREKAKTIGYYAMFEYVNGFKKAIYWSKEKMEAHAMQYSQGYRADKQKKTAYTFWSKDFDGMAYKTMLRQLISKWGIMSIDMQTAYESDMAYIREDGSKEYVDNKEDIQEATYEEKEVKGLDEI
jgi:recombination protein RecT